MIPVYIFTDNKINQKWLSWVIVSLSILLLVGCSFTPPLPQPTATLLPSPLPSDTPVPTPFPSDTPDLTPAQPTATSAATGIHTETVVPPDPTETPAPLILRFAVIGDYGSGNQDEADRPTFAGAQERADPRQLFDARRARGSRRTDGSRRPCRSTWPSVIRHWRPSSSAGSRQRTPTPTRHGRRSPTRTGEARFGTTRL